MDRHTDAALVCRNDESRFHSAFPGASPSELTSVLETLPPATHPSSADDIGPVTVRGASVHISCRIYLPEPAEDAVARLSEKGQAILSCWYTRHHDGRVREKYLRRVLMTDAEPWTVPFVVQLLGEYVRELLDLVSAHADALQGEHYRRFSEENPTFVRLTKQRIVSYWSCYQRHNSRRFRDYVGFRLADALGWWLPRERRRILER